MSGNLGAPNKTLDHYGEQVRFEQRTSDPSTAEEGEAWLRTDIAPETNQLATLRFDNGGGNIDIPIFETGTSVDTVREVLRIPVGGITGYVPIAPPDDASLDQLRLQHNSSIFGFHNDVEPRSVIPDSALYHWKYSEGSGSTTADDIGSADGTVNGPSWVSGDWTGDYALDSGAVGDHVATTTLSDFASQFDTNFAIAMTVKTTGSGYLLGTEATGSDALNLRTGIRTNGGEVDFVIRDENENPIEVYSSSGLIDDGAKHRVLINKTSNSASGLEVYVDQQKESTTTQDDTAFAPAITAFTNELYHFSRNLDGSVDGEIDSIQDDILFCQDSLTSAEIQDDYERQPFGFRVQESIDEQSLFSKAGHVGLRGFVDVDGDGNKELIMNIGSEADFAAINLNDLSTVWRSTQDTTKSKMAYYPQIIDGDSALAYGHRSNDTVYCVNLSDGTLRWSYAASGSLQSLEQCDAGLVVGSNGTGGETTLLNYTDGTALTGWPVAFKQYEQLLGSGDLDGDGQDEIVLNDNSGNIEVRNQDGTLAFSISSSHGHVDQNYIGDIHPTNSGNELLVVIDDDGSSTGPEGDEFVLFDSTGTEVTRYTLSAGGPNYAVDNFLPNQDGLEIVYGMEGSDTLGLLDGTLTSQWSTTVASRRIGSGGLGQVSAGDIDGDGNLEIIANADETDGSGILVFDTDGNLIRKRTQAGWDSDPQNHLSNAAIGAKTFVDFDGDGRAEYHASRSAASDTTTNDRIDISYIV